MGYFVRVSQVIFTTQIAPGFYHFTLEIPMRRHDVT
jgi:hypothetical protein